MMKSWIDLCHSEAVLLPKSTRRSLPMSLLRAREAVMSNFRPMLQRHDVTEQQWRVLRVLSERGALEASELAERASILAPSLTRIIKTLEDRRMLDRKKVASDGRKVRLSIAPAGRELIESAASERRAIYRDIERRIGRDDTDKLLDMLDTLVKRLER